MARPRRVPLLLLPLAASRTVPMPRRSLESLTFDDFDDDYLNRKPVIIEGASICPEGITLETLGPRCTQERSLKQFEQGGGDWAGLRQLRDKSSVPAFLASMRERQEKGSAPRYLFDVHTYRHCPSVMPLTQVPAHLSTVFMKQWSGKWSNCSIGHWNIFLAEKGFKTDLHMDAKDWSFVASMCSGRKTWRVMTNADTFKHRKTLKIRDGVERKGRLVQAEVPKRIETWANTSILEREDIRVYEGTIKPGEVIYIPGGAPHAAHTLDDSLMFAANDGTKASMAWVRKLAEECHALKERRTIGKKGRKGKGEDPQLARYCKVRIMDEEYEEWDHYTMLKNMKKHGKSVLREEKSWREAYRCQGDAYCRELLDSFPESSIVREYCRKQHPGHVGEL